MTVVAQETYLPEGDGYVAHVYDFLQAHEGADRGESSQRYFLSGARRGDQVELPPGVYRVLRQVVEVMQQGLAVTVAPQSQTLTSQQAADLLGISRPTLIKLLDAGQIRYERIGTHRRVMLRDLLAYRAKRREEQYAALAATAADFETEEDLESTLRQLRDARREVAKRRRGKTA
jgi:excisionase family DNA binding protein